jgi:hypothetical protein
MAGYNMTPPRKLAAILAAGVAGYSLLSGLPSRRRRASSNLRMAD